MNSFRDRIYAKLARTRAVLLTPKFPAIYTDSSIDIQCLGSDYGRKFFSSNLRRSPLIISGGVGEDISFDVEFISQYHARVFLFDPTPRAIQHIVEVRQRFGASSECSYSVSGKQAPKSYDLREVGYESLILMEFALLDEPKIVKFYAPPVSEHVSFSVQNIQNRFTPKGAYFEVEAIGPKEVTELIGTNIIDVLKLDIEGSEYLYLSSSFDQGIFPNQILIEIDELHFPSLKSRKIAKKIFRLLENYGYILIYIDGFNFTYIRSINK
jgi:hypothetical protein